MRLHSLYGHRFRTLPYLFVIILLAVMTNAGLQSAQALTFTVTKTADTNDGVCNSDCSLREAITAANTAVGTDSISFSAAVFNPGTITLGSALPNITTDMNISGLGAALVKIDGANSFQVFNIAFGVTVNISGVTITHGNFGVSGGGIYNHGTLTVTSSTIDSNYGAAGGGGIDNVGSLTVLDSIISNNIAEGGIHGGDRSQGGGGINSDSDTTLTIMNSTFSGNTSLAEDGGGVVIGSSSVLTIINSTFSGNSASISGGGISSGGKLTITNSTFFGNWTPGKGGAISQGFGSTIITNSTFSDNSASDGGGFYDFRAPLILNNSVIANSSGGGDCTNFLGTVTANHSLIEDGTCGIVNGVDGNLVGDPSLGVLTGNPAYFPLTMDSKAINAGSNVLIPSGVTMDQAGNPRILNGTVDMGSFESNLLPPTSTPTLTPSPTSTPTRTPTPLPTYFTEPVEDAYIDSAAPNTNFGAANRLNVVSGGSMQATYLRFKVTSVPNGILRATLRLFVTDGTTGTSRVYTVSNTYANSVNDWLENGLTWNNAPPVSGSPLVSVTGATSGTWLEYDVTAAGIFTEGHYSFAITNSSADLLSFESFENGRNLPQLVIEPASLPTQTNTRIPTSTSSGIPDTSTPTPTTSGGGEGVIEATATPVTQTVVESNSSPVLRSAGWVGQVAPAGASGESYLVSTLPNDSLKLTFIGTSVDIIYVQGPTFGAFSVVIDGATFQSVDAAAPTYTFGSHFTIGGLPEGKHELRVNVASGTVGIDAFVVQQALESEQPPSPIEIPTATPPAPPFMPTNPPAAPGTEVPPVTFKR